MPKKPMQILFFSEFALVSYGEDHKNSSIGNYYPGIRTHGSLIFQTENELHCPFVGEKRRKNDALRHWVGMIWSKGELFVGRSEPS